MEVGLPNNKDDMPLKHYSERFAELDPAEASERTGLSFDRARGAFVFRLMGTEYAIGHPAGTVTPGGLRTNERILLLRYLCEGRFGQAGGRRLSYHETPWGNTYYRQFEGRVLKRAAYTFTGDIAGFRRKVDASPVQAERIAQSDAGYRFMFLDGFFVTLMLYAGDDEFPPSAQMLFDDNFLGAFSAEDMAVVGEIVIQRLQSL
jgi:hypothetical protein